MKSFNIKYALCITAEGEQLKPDILRKSWSQLWPEVMIQSDQIEKEQNNGTQEIIIKDSQTVQPNDLASDVKEWIRQYEKDCETGEQINDNQIIAAVLENDVEETVYKGADGDDEPFIRVSHTRTLSILPFSTSIPMDISNVTSILMHLT